MEPEMVSSRLSRINTHWSIVQKAHDDPGGLQENRSRTDAMSELWEQYHRAVHRYLTGLLRARGQATPELADELTQEFGLRLVSGKFGNAHPGLGRFRDYLKQCLRHLIHDHFRARRRLPESLAEDVPAPLIGDEEFLTCCREQLINNALDDLARSKPSFHVALTLRIDHPELRVHELAERLSTSPGQFRTTLCRARAMFAGILIRHVQNTVSSSDLLIEELSELGLLRYCLQHVPGPKE